MSAPAVRYTPLPPHSALGAQVVRNLGMYVLIIGLVSGSVSVRQSLAKQSLLGRPVIWLGVMAIPIFAYVIGTLIGHASAGRRAKRELAALSDHPDRAHPDLAWSAAIYGCVSRDPITPFMPESARVWRSLLEGDASSPRPIAVVDEQLREGLAESTDDLLEPESIEPSQNGMVAVAILFLVLASLSVVQGGGSRWWNLLVFGTLSAYFISRHPPVRNALPILRDTGRDLVAGPGWVAQTKQDNRWTVEDSMMLILRRGAKARRPVETTPIVVRLIGPPGVRDIQFASMKDPDFRQLWERWATSKPRLDLVA